MPNTLIKTSIFNHASTHIDAAVDRVWADQKHALMSGHRFAELGYEITPIEGDPAAFRGGYHMILKDEKGETLDERIVHIVYANDEARILSIYAQYLTESANGLTVNATYEVSPIDSATLFAMTSSSQINISFGTEKHAHADYVAAVQKLEDSWNLVLEQGLQQLKARYAAQD